jgi:UDP-N-acetylmuramoyl-tripeptide--D-alanyl-D-alanine ligase
MRDWTLQRVAAATGGTTFGDAEVALTGVTTDSRTAGAGTLFVAIAGEHFDGHDFCDRAVAAGAAAVMVRAGRRTELRPRIEVDDTVAGLLAMAVARRAELRVPVIAITGSTGKTSTKDMAAAAMGETAWASPASYNNEIGVPLTVLGAPDTASALVVEVGSRGRGHIASLAPAIVPDVAVVTNLGLVHLETFGSTEALAASKSELLEAIVPGGVAVLPYGERRLSFDGTVVRFGEHPAADVAVSGVRLDDMGRASFRLDGLGGSYAVQLAVAGAHQPLNAAAAAAAAVAAGRDPGAALDGISGATGSPWRMEVHRGRFIVVNDAYNANPTSMEAALRTTAQLADTTIAVLGIMAELGEVSEAEHRRIGRLATDLGFNPVVVVGTAPGLAEGAAAAAVPVADLDEALAAVIDSVPDGAAVLVKGSRVAGLELLAQRLIEAAAA